MSLEKGCKTDTSWEIKKKNFDVINSIVYKCPLRMVVKPKLVENKSMKRRTFDVIKLHCLQISLEKRC